MLARLKEIAGDAPGIRFTPRLSFDGLRAAYARCRALVFTAEEDFGLVPIEVMASGRPVLALGRGGALETVVPGVTGQFYAENSVEALAGALEDFEAWLPGFRPEDALARAREFSPEQFRAEVEAAVARGFADLRERLAPPARKQGQRRRRCLRRRQRRRRRKKKRRSKTLTTTTTMKTPPLWDSTCLSARASARSRRPLPRP